MRKNRGFDRVLIAIFILLAASTPAGADVARVVVHGDSLSDNGNLYAATGSIYPPPPYIAGRESNGPVTVEQLAGGLEVPLLDFAWIGATTGIGNCGDGGTPISLSSGSLPGMFLEYAHTAPADVIARAVGNFAVIITGLQAGGAQHILAPGIPDWGLTPYFMSLGPGDAAAVSAASDLFNAALRSSLPAGVRYYDTAGLMRSIVRKHAAYRLTNVTNPCLTGALFVGAPAAIFSATLFTRRRRRRRFSPVNPRLPPCGSRQRFSFCVQ